MFECENTDQLTDEVIFRLDGKEAKSVVIPDDEEGEENAGHH